VSPRRFERRTYMIVAPGWSALAFKAAMSASSASTTIRSAFPFTLSPTVNCQDIFCLLQELVSARTPWVWSDNLQWSHHLVVLMLQDVAVCQTNRPLVGNRTLMRVISPGGQSTVSLRPVSQSGGILDAPCGAMLMCGGLQAKYDVRGSARHPVRST